MSREVHLLAFGSTRSQIADEIEAWFRSRAADGFVLTDSGLPGQFDDFVDQVVPILRKRGLFRHEYADTALRSHLGLPVPLPGVLSA